MDIDEDDDFYAPEEAEAPTTAADGSKDPAPTSKVEPDEDLEEGEEEDEGAMDEDEDDSVRKPNLSPQDTTSAADPHPGH